MGAFSYLIPGECAEKRINWRFNSLSNQGKTITSALEELASLVDLRLERRAQTHVFSGKCQENVPEPIEREELLRVYQPLPFVGPTQSIGSPIRLRQVRFPVQPLGQ
jgi:hypothetical protein